MTSSEIPRDGKGLASPQAGRAAGPADPNPQAVSAIGSIPDAFERRVEFRPSFDKRDPDPSKNYGVGAVKIVFYLIGPEGAVQWMIGTDWYIPSAAAHMARFREAEFEPRAWDLGYHSREPHYDGQQPVDDECDVIGGPCYYDGSTLNAERLMPGFLAEGDAYVWRELEAYYNAVFAQAKARRAETQGGSIADESAESRDD